MHHFIEVIVDKEGVWTQPRTAASLDVPTAHTQKFMWCMVLFQRLNNLLSCMVNVESSILKVVMM